MLKRSGCKTPRERDLWENLGVAEKKKTPWSEVRERTIPTERPPLVGEVIANLCG
jgi:hypothetical protein